MLLDIAFLIQCLGSTAWTWTTEALDRLLRDLGLQEVRTDAPVGRREFKAGTGLACHVFADPQGPERFEFPFPVPSADRVSRVSMSEHFVALMSKSLTAVLGPASPPMRWELGSSMITLEARPSGDDALGSVALVISRRGVAERADAADGASRRRPA